MSSDDNRRIYIEEFDYDAAGNVNPKISDDKFQYDINNRLTSFNDNPVTYDMDGNMLSNGTLSCTYDSRNKLITANGHTYKYDAEGVRIRNLCDGGEESTYIYNTNCKLSQVLMKTTGDVVTKYVYGRGLIGEETCNEFKTYHFDCRGSTVAITDENGNITDTFAYDTYGRQTERTDTSNIIFGYNGRDGVVTDANGLIYMRARYYSPEMRRFINADIIAGQISNAITLNRYAYANGNPVSFVDPFGLWSIKNAWNSLTEWFDENVVEPVEDAVSTVGNAIVSGIQKINKFVDDVSVAASHAIVDGAAAAYDYFIDTATTVGGAIADGVRDAANWTNENIVQPAGDWFGDIGKWLNKYARNKDGSYALYDNQRFKDSVFHEQILVFTPSGPSFNLKEGNIGLGSLGVDAITGGWEGEHANFSLLDFGHAEVGAEIKDGNVRFGALASIWSPSFSFDVFGVTVEIGAEVGSIGAGVDIGKKGIKAKGACAFGFSIGVSW